MYSGYLAFAGNELINNSRTSTYATALNITNVNCGPCDGLHRALYDLPYSSPDADNAPWYDPIVPESKDFAGLLGLEILGMSKTVAARGVVPLTERGAALHPLRRTHREIQVNAIALARTEQAMSYGLSWLASALRGNFCSSGCSGDQLCLFTTCPPCPPPPTDPLETDPCGDLSTQYWRELYNVGLLAMDEPQPVRRVSGGWIASVTFTLAAGDPMIYREPTLMATGPQPSQVLPDYVDPGVPADCTESVDCLRDPTCPVPPAPVLAPVPVDVCFPKGSFTAGRFVISLPQDRVPVWAEKVPLIYIRAGGQRMERLTIRWYGNPTDLDCNDVLDPCAACAEVNIAAIPAGSTLTIDGRSEVASVDCPGGPGLITAEPVLYARGGAPFVWPVFSCNDGMCIEVIAKADTIAEDASIEIFYVVREDAA